MRHFAHADTVFTRAGAVMRQGPRHQPFLEDARVFDFLRIGFVHQHNHMEIAVPDMADNRRQQAKLTNVRMGLGDAVGQPGNRDAYIGAETDFFRRQTPRGVIGVMARLPQPVAPSSRVAQSNSVPPLPPPIHRLHSAPQPPPESHETHEQMRGFGRKLRVTVHRFDGHVQQFSRAIGMPDWMVSIVV